MANISFTISVETTQAQAWVTCSNIKNVDDDYKVRLTYGTVNSDTYRTVLSGKCAKTLTSKTIHVSELTTGKTYYFRCQVFTAKKTTTRQVRESTKEMAGTLEVAEKNPSAVLVKLTGISPFSYDMEVVFRYKKNDGTSEIKDVYTYEIPSRKKREPQYSFSGLTQNTEYTFYADVYNVMNGIKRLNRSFTVVESTPRYTPGYIPHVYVDKSLVVPYIGKGLIWLTTDRDFGTDYGIIKYVSTDGGETYGDREVVTHLPLQISGDVGSTKLYKFCVIDASQTEHNEVVEEVTFPALPFTERTTGDPVDLTASEVKILGEAALLGYEYWRHFFNSGRADDEYEVLKSAVAELDEGDLIEGGATSVLNAIGELIDGIMNGDAYDVAESGEPITAGIYNGIYQYLIYLLGIL